MKGFLWRTFGEEFSSLIILNLISCALCLTVVGTGPAVLALTGTIIKINDDRADHDRVREFLRTFKDKFWNGVLFELCFVLYVAALIVCRSLVIERVKPNFPLMGQVIDALITCAFVVAGMVSICTGIVLSSWKCSFGTGLWNGICLAFGRAPRTILSTVVVYGFLYLLYPVFWPVSAVFYVFVMISITCTLKIGFLWTPICTLLLDRDPDYDVVKASAKADSEEKTGEASQSGRKRLGDE